MVVKWLLSGWKGGGGGGGCGGGGGGCGGLGFLELAKPSTAIKGFVKRGEVVVGDRDD